MNVILEKLLSDSLLDEKDKYEIRQIFQFVSDEKKQNIIRNFGFIASSILQIKLNLKEEQEILLGRAISNMENTIKEAKISGIKDITTYEITNLKKKL